jgi:hypothetical protein
MLVTGPMCNDAGLAVRIALPSGSRPCATPIPPVVDRERELLRHAPSHRPRAAEVAKIRPPAHPFDHRDRIASSPQPLATPPFQDDIAPNQDRRRAPDLNRGDVEAPRLQGTKRGDARTRETLADASCPSRASCAACAASVARSPQPLATPPFQDDLAPNRVRRREPDLNRGDVGRERGRSAGEVRRSPEEIAAGGVEGRDTRVRGRCRGSRLALRCRWKTPRSSRFPASRMR